MVAGTVVLSWREEEPRKPLKMWLAGVLLQDLCYFVFLLSKIPYIKRLQHRLVLEVPYSVFTLDLMFTLYPPLSAYLVWLIPGNLWYWKCKNCYEAAPLLVDLCSVYIFAGYGYAFIPLAIVVSACVSLPFLILVIIFFLDPGQTPANEDLLKSLKEEKFNPEVHKEQTTCAICACDFESSHSVIVLSCDPRHFFHPDCIKKWLAINANCPICRSSLVPSPSND